MGSVNGCVSIGWREYNDRLWAREKSVKAEKRDRNAEREKKTFRRQRHHQSPTWLMMALTPKRLFLCLCISISLLRLYTFFSRSQSVIIFFLKMSVSSKELFSTLKISIGCTWHRLPKESHQVWPTVQNTGWIRHPQKISFIFSFLHSARTLTTSAHASFGRRTKTTGQGSGFLRRTWCSRAIGKLA